MHDLPYDTDVCVVCLLCFRNNQRRRRTIVLGGGHMAGLSAEKQASALVMGVFFRSGG